MIPLDLLKKRKPGMYIMYIYIYIYTVCIYCIYILYTYIQFDFPGVSAVKNLPAKKEPEEMRFWSLGWEDLLGKEKATHSSILSWKTPWTEEPGGLQSIALQRVWRDWSDLAYSIYTYTYDTYSYKITVCDNHYLIHNSIWYT